MPQPNPLDRMLDEAVDQYGRAIWNKKNTRYKDRLSGIVFSIGVLTDLPESTLMRYMQYRHSDPGKGNGRSGHKVGLWEWVNAQKGAVAK